jgi:RNA polymerase sigma-70 factor (ECF subfamily)
MHGSGAPAAGEIAATTDAETLFRQYAPWVARYVRRLGFRRDEDVEDIVQETFLVAHRRGGFREGPARATTWLAEIALRVGMASRRTHRRLPIPDEDAIDAAPSTGSDPLAGAIHAETLANVQRALDSLEIERRALFVLFELEGESCDALATAFDVPIGTIYSRLHAARGEFLETYRRLSGEQARTAKRGRA